jgi:hypothetical protein
MSKYSLGSNVDPKKFDETEESKREWKPTVRMTKRQESLRTKLRMSDLYPDKQYIKEVNNGELRYFILLVIPVVVSAIFAAVQRDDLFNKLVDIIVKFFIGQ